MADLKPKSDLTAEQVRDALDYDPETGIFVRRWRDDLPLQTNRRYAGKPAGTPHGRRKAYISIKLYGGAYKAHRLAWLHFYGRWPVGPLDHINGDGHDNRIANLRECTKSENRCNSVVRRDNPTGHKGVQIHSGGRFQASVMKDGVRHHLGLFKTLEEAVAVRQEAARRLHGEFARES